MPATHSDRFDEAALLAEARATSGLTEFGDEGFRAPLRELLRALAGARLNAIGAASLRGRLVESLVTRLRAEEWFRRHPEILDETIEGPTVVVGMTRTGTTMLQRVLACDARHYSALWWETRHPTPYPGTHWDTPDPRIPDAVEEVRQILEASPEQAAIHPWDAEAPDEEIMLLEHTFLSHVPEAMCNVPEWREWLDEQDFTPAYRYLKRLLQFLQWQKKQRGESRGRWVLKTPGHLGYLDTLFSVFPDAHVAQTHRNPNETIPSSASLNLSLWRMNSDDVDPREVGQQWKERMAWSTRRCLTVRDAMPDASERFTDIWFRDALSDPLPQVERIYAATGTDLIPEARAAMERWLIDNARDKRPTHQYSADEFGFEPGEIDAAFADYVERFIAPRDGR